MNDILYTTSLKPLWKAILNLSALFIFIVCLDVVVDILFGINLIFEPAVERNNTWPVIVLGLAIIGSVFSMVYSFFYEIEVTESGFRKKGVFGSFSLHYDDIEEVFCDKGIVSFKSDGKAVSLGSLYTNFGEIFSLVENKIEGRSDISFTGKKKRIKKFFPGAVED